MLTWNTALNDMWLCVVLWLVCEIISSHYIHAVLCHRRIHHQCYHRAAAWVTWPTFITDGTTTSLSIRRWCWPTSYCVSTSTSLSVSHRHTHTLINRHLVPLPSVIWRCWLGGRKGIRPVKTEWWDAGMVICLGWDADLHMPSWCHCHSLSLAPVNPDSFYLPGFTFLVLAHPGCPEHSPGGRNMVVEVVVVVY